ncbi:DMT family transporter [Clostridium lundense]|uniref:DMT family transporter n=1 Tax=Clostridium lundense TaxID=319475 RepID=UPI000489871E|nr:DMT family transporter [Clostridium lundense]
MNHWSKSKKAVFYMILSSFCFAIMAALVKLSGEVQTFEKVFLRDFVNVTITVMIIKKNKEKIWGSKKNRKYLMLRGVFGALGAICYFYCIDNTTILADSSMLNKMHPFFVIIFAACFLKEKLTGTQVVTLILSFLGALCIIKPKFDVSVLPAIVGILSAAFAGAAYTLVRYLGDKENSYTVVFYFSFISSCISLPFVIFNFQPLAIEQLSLLVASGCLAAMAQFSLTVSYKYAEASKVSIYNYTNVIFSQMIAFVLWREIPDYLSILGYMLIIAPSVWMFLKCEKQDKGLSV